MSNFIDRCRLILLANPDGAEPQELVSAVEQGYISSCILYQAQSTEVEFSRFCETVCPLLQEHNVAVLVADDTQVFGRCGADGIFLFKNRGDLEQAMDRFSPKFIVGCGGYKDRDGALKAGEAKPDFVFFGKPGGDIREEAHPKNLAHASWWSEMIEISSVVMAGTSLESVVECAKTGADFVAVETYVFAHPDGSAEAVNLAEQHLEAHAPRFEEAEA